MASPKIARSASLPERLLPAAATSSNDASGGAKVSGKTPGGKTQGAAGASLYTDAAAAGAASQAAKVTGRATAEAAPQHRVANGLPAHQVPAGRLSGVGEIAALAATSSAPAERKELRLLLEAEDHRRGDDPILKAGLTSRSPRVVARALLAVGRIGVPELSPAVLGLLAHPDAEVRRTAAFCLWLLRSADALAAVTARLEVETEGAVRDQLYRAVGQLGGVEAFPLLLAALAKETDATAQTGLAMGICSLVRGSNGAVPREILDRLADLAAAPAPVGAAAARALSAFSGDVGNLSETKLLAALAKAEPSAKALLLMSLGKLTSDTVHARLVELLSASEPAGVRVEAQKALARRPWTPELAESMLRLARDPEPMVASQALSVIAGKKVLDAAQLDELRSIYASAPSAAQRRDAFVALANCAPTAALVYAAADSGEALLKRAALGYLLQFDEGPTRLVAALNSKDMGVVVGAFTAMLSGKFAMTDAAKAVVLRQLERHDYVCTYYVGQCVAQFGWQDALPQMIKAATEKWRPEEFMAQLGCLNAFGALKAQEALPLVEKALHDPLPAVVAPARDAYTAITGLPAPVEVPANQVVDEATPSDAEIARALKTTVTFHTDKGDFTLEMLPEAPVTAAKFVRACERGFYDRIPVPVHRTVPDYVVQLGTHRGDSYGEGGLMRSEVSMVHHAPGTVGKATAGKDTANSQFFVDLADNGQLDGAYTAFARLIDGLEVVARLEAADRVLGVKCSRGK